MSIRLLPALNTKSKLAKWKLLSPQLSQLRHAPRETAAHCQPPSPPLPFSCVPAAGWPVKAKCFTLGNPTPPKEMQVGLINLSHYQRVWHLHDLQDTVSSIIIDSYNDFFRFQAPGYCHLSESSGSKGNFWKVKSYRLPLLKLYVCTHGLSHLYQVSGLKTCGSIDSAVVRRAGETQGNAKAFHTCKCTRDRTWLGSLTKNAGNETDKKPGENEDYWSNDDKNSVPLPPPSLFQHLLSAAATTQTSLTDKMERPVWSLPYFCLSKIMS